MKKIKNNSHTYIFKKNVRSRGLTYLVVSLFLLLFYLFTIFYIFIDFNTSVLYFFFNILFWFVLLLMVFRGIYFFFKKGEWLFILNDDEFRCNFPLFEENKNFKVINSNISKVQLVDTTGTDEISSVILVVILSSGESFEFDGGESGINLYKLLNQFKKRNIDVELL